MTTALSTVIVGIIGVVMILVGGHAILNKSMTIGDFVMYLFFTGMMATDKADNEWIEAVAFPRRRPGTGYGFAEIARRHGDFAIVACAAVVDRARMRFAVAGVADRPTARDFPILDG